MQREEFEAMAALQSRHWWFRGRRRILARLIAGLGLPDRASLLEVGTGTGGNLGMLARFGAVKGVERDDYARGVARRLAGPGVEVAAGELPDGLPFDGERFDLVCLLDVLEHVDDDRAVLAALRARTRDGGFLLLTVPAYRWLWSAHDQALGHKRRYTAGRLRAVVPPGWRLRRVSYFNTLLSPPAMALRFHDRLFRRQRPTGHGLPPAPINALLEAVFAAERHWLARAGLPFGLSLLAVLEAE